jgi:Plant transposon protein
MKDYFADQPVYNSFHFNCRFKVLKQIFIKLNFRSVMIIGSKSKICMGLLGLSEEQKLTASFQLFAYGEAPDATDKYFCMAQSTDRKDLKHFCKHMIEVFKPIYLCMSSRETFQEISHNNAGKVFPGIIGSLDCMHWFWKYCPKA